MGDLKPMFIVLLMLTSALAGCVANSDSNSEIVINNLSGQDFSFQDLNNSTIETKDEKSIIKFKNDFYLIRPETKLQFVSKNLLKVIKGSVHA